MDKQRSRLFLFGIFSVIVLLVPISMIVKQETVMQQGKEFRFRTRPVDPFDAFRGRFVALSIQETSAVKPSNLNLKHGQQVCAFIEEGRDGFAGFKDVALRPKSGVPYLKCRVQSVSGNKVNLDVPIDRYYMEESKAPAAEQLYFRHSRRNLSEAYVVVAIKDGIPVIKKLYVGGKPIEEALKEPPAEEPPIPRPAPQPVRRPPELPGPVERIMQPPDLELPDLTGWTLIYPSEANVQSCRDSAGKTYPATGPGAARWFNWNGCGHMKGYDVTPGQQIILYAYGDDCPSCVCYNADFMVYEQKGYGWAVRKSFDLPQQPGLHIPVFYTPGFSKIRVITDTCFYLDVYVRAAVSAYPQTNFQEDWVSHIASGRQFTVTFDHTADKFDDSTFTGDPNTDPMGILQGGQTYSVVYRGGRWACTGFNQWTRGSGTFEYDNADPRIMQMSLWGRVYSFDNEGNVYDPEFGHVGTMKRM